MTLEETQDLYKSLKQAIRRKYSNNYRKMHGKPMRRYVQLRKINIPKWREVPSYRSRNGYVISNGKEIMFVD